AEHNKLDSAIEFKTMHFSEFKPHEKYDIVLCEMLSSMMLIEQQIPASLHITKHVLKPEGILLPKSVQIFGILSQSESMLSRFAFQDLRFPSRPQTVGAEERIELSDIEEIVKFDLRSLDDDYRVRKTLTFDIKQDGIAHGLCGMFQAALDDEIILDMEDGWKELFLPFEIPRKVKEGDCVKVKIEYLPGEFDSVRLLWIDNN
ncbi:MAG: hypothetical protein ACFFED_12885, partial [Candidatus Thorarchaeota archaeon]